MTEQPRLVKSHRTLGYDLGHMPDPVQQGIELVILRTGPNPNDLAVSPAHLLMPVSANDCAFDLRMMLTEVIERARFLGVPDDALHGLLDAELRETVPA